MEDLRGELHHYAPPAAQLGPPQMLHRLSLDGQLWYAFAKLHAALEEREVHEIRAMPPHEREARFHSAHLVEEIVGEAALEELNRFGLEPVRGRRVYRLSAGSQLARIREGDFLLALAPRDRGGFLDLRLANVNADVGGRDQWRHLEQITQATVVDLDRDRLVVVIDQGTFKLDQAEELERRGLVDLSRDVMLDPVHRDFFTPKLEATLREIGNPQVAQENPFVGAALGTTRRARRSRPTPVADVLWQPQRLADDARSFEVDGVQEALRHNGVRLNPSQWNAWRSAMQRRLQLVWGPPGTGKTRTCQAVVAGEVAHATQSGKPVRVLIAAPTYHALDLVLLQSLQRLEEIAGGDLVVSRLRSRMAARPPDVPEPVDCPVGQSEPLASEVVRRLAQCEGITVVGGVPQQVHNLMMKVGGQPVQDWFDLILIDEASQVDVAHAILVLSGLAAGGRVVVAGDPLQLPPIHQPTPPTGLEDMVGSIYKYFHDHHGISHAPLLTNYRSNLTLVRFGDHVGYPPELEPESADLEIRLRSAERGAVPPDDWPARLEWTPNLGRLLNPAEPAAVFVYPEGRSSHWNDFEADTIGALTWLLRSDLLVGLANDRDPDSGPVERPWDAEDFWSRAVGIVTPHRAQQGLIVSTLQSLFPDDDPSRIREAVDTVERFQGQQRDVMLASFSLGDPDSIRDEEEFLLGLNRFNVMASRARAKLVVLVSQELVSHLSNDIEVLRNSRLLKQFASLYCEHAEDLTLLRRSGTGEVIDVPGELRVRAAR